jgi:hypothetical protein
VRCPEASTPEQAFPRSSPPPVAQAWAVLRRESDAQARIEVKIFIDVMFLWWV